MGMSNLQAYATHSPYSDPGRHAALVAAVDPDPNAIHRIAWNTILHYRAGDVALSEQQRDDIDRRWLSVMLDEAQDRAPGPLDLPREPGQRLAGCCRDHTLLAVSVLRQHGIPARSRVGFSGYFTEGFHYDHVVAEYWNGDRWVRFDPELDQEHFAFDVHDMPTGRGAPFQTAAEAWTAIRAGDADPATFGVDPSMPMLCGAGFVAGYVVTELAHRMRDEVLLWDVWGTRHDALKGAPTQRADDERTDIVAGLLIRADRNDTAAEDELVARYAAEPGLAPGRSVVTMSPMGRRGETDLVSRTTRWATDPWAEVAGFTVSVQDEP